MLRHPDFVKLQDVEKFLSIFFAHVLSKCFVHLRAASQKLQLKPNGFCGMADITQLTFLVSMLLSQCENADSQIYFLSANTSISISFVNFVISWVVTPEQFIILINSSL